MDEDLMGMLALADGVQRMVVVPEPLFLALEEFSGRPQIADRVWSHGAPPGRSLGRQIKASPKVGR